MPKLIYLSVVLSLCLSVTALGQSGLRTANSVQVESGFIDESVVLADDDSQLFLEFIKGDRVAKKLDGQIYEGEILPPLRIDAPAKAPRARMRELLSFEVISDNNEEIELIDQFTALHPKDRLRQGFKNQAGQRRLGAQLIAIFEAEDAVSRPALWHYDEANLNPRWERLGGIMGETPAGESQIFSAFIYGTGRFTIWDENPQPDFQPSFPNDEIELAEASPFPSVTDSEINNGEEVTEQILSELEDLEIQTEGEQTAILNDETERPLIPAVESPSSNLIPAAPSNSLPNQNTSQVPQPSDLQSSAPLVPSVTSPSNSLLSQYFQENLLVLSSAERNSLGNPTTEIVEAFEAKRVINTNDQASESIRADLLAQADLQILTAELAEIVIDSIDNQIALVNGLETTEEQALWVNIEQPNAAKALNKIEEIQTWQTNHALVYANLDLNSPAKLKIDLIPKLKAHYEAYFTLPVTSASALQTNTFQDFGVNEGDLPEAGGFRFPWLILVVLAIFGFSVYTLRQKPY